MLSILLVSVFSVMSFASESAYKLNMQLRIDGELVATPQLTVEEGKKASITTEHKGRKVFLDVTPTTHEIAEDERASVFMKFTVGEIKSDGKKVVLSNPKIMTMEHEQAAITQSDSNGKETLHVEVVPESVIQ